MDTISEASLSGSVNATSCDPGEKPVSDFVASAVEDLYHAASRADDVFTRTIDRQQITDHLAAISDRTLLTALRAEFGERLFLESQKHSRAVCPKDMRIYTAINMCLGERLRQV